MSPGSEKMKLKRLECIETALQVGRGAGIWSLKAISCPGVDPLSRELKDVSCISVLPL